MDGIKEQLKEIYLNGVKQGYISACAILYEVMTSAGIEEDNMFIEIIKDLAKRNGCDDIKSALSKQ